MSFTCAAGGSRPWRQLPQQLTGDSSTGGRSHRNQMTPATPGNVASARGGIPQTKQEGVTNRAHRKREWRSQSARNKEKAGNMPRAPIHITGSPSFTGALPSPLRSTADTTTRRGRWRHGQRPSWAALVGPMRAATTGHKTRRHHRQRQRNKRSQRPGY